ncbi:MAG: glycoside hydrolase family 3 C-terminal domain-containing protein [Bacteroidales bacterium]|nr:glycoside hydrolase family 3 C-terminal domain-containing protein [Bacteroidales bacterium]MCB9013937.1 glycoside hydrolase family 3 C-terminal domain-containing protein [Bacteroidales bacterium]
MNTSKFSFYLSLLFGILLLTSCGKKYEFPFQNPALSIEERVNDLVSRMTLEEKISQMMNQADSIPRLGIPDYNWWSEGLHGVAAAGVATVFPQAIALGATWNDSLIQEVADVISTEFRAKFNDFQSKGDHGIFKGLTVWSPNINIFRDPRWGRGQETYGEDPYLTARIGVAFVKGLQGDDPKYFKVISTPKHYAVHSGPEPLRHHFDAVCDYRDFADTYTPAFYACITEGKAYSIMGAYQRYLGVPCCASDYLLKDVLRDKWGFQGYVVSDCGAIRDIYANHKYVDSPEKAAALGVLAGCDLECGDTYSSLKEAVEQGLLKESDIDVSVKRLFTARFKLGLFDPPSEVKYAQIPITENDSKEHRALALKAAHQSIVLLKNENNTLPLKKNLKTIAVIGPNADMADVLYGNYNGVSSNPVTPLQGIKNKLGKDCNVIFAAGSSLTDEAPQMAVMPEDLLSNPDGAGLKAEYFNNISLEGQPVLSRIDKTVDFNYTQNPPQTGLSDDFSVRWTGDLTVKDDGDYMIGFNGDDGYRIFIDGKLMLELWTTHAPTRKYFKMHLNAGQKYKMVTEYFQGRGGAVASLLYGKVDKDPMAPVVNAAMQADAIIYVGGISAGLEGEEMSVDIDGFKGGDRTSLDLPAIQLNILKALKESGKPVVLVLLNGSALSVNWANENIPAIVEAWYPGEEGGNAIADVLFGDYNPAGRLPLTFYKSVKDLPPFEDYNMTNRTYRYFSGVPLYEFGYGLSYTTFSYSNLNASQTISSDQSLKVSVDVLNSGKMDGDEVVELYLKIVNPKFPSPIHALKSFKRINLKAGEGKTVEFVLSPRDLSLINDNNQRVVVPGLFEIFVGGCQPSVKAIDSGKVLKSGFEVTGSEFLVD